MMLKSLAKSVCLFVIILYSGYDKLLTPLPSGAKHQPDGENPATLKVLQKV
jgi:hypothetical protein